MDQQAKISDPPEFVSLSSAREYADAVQESISSLGGSGLVDALQSLERVYREFPELELDRPRRALVRDIRTAAVNMPDRAAIPLLVYCVALDTSCSRSVTALLDKIAELDSWPSLAPALGMLCRSREFCWPAIRPIVSLLRQQGRTDTVGQVILEVLDCVDLTGEESASEFGDLLIGLLSDEHPVGSDSRAFAEAVRSASRRLRRPPRGQDQPRSTDVLLAMARRLKAVPSPQRRDRHPDLACPSGNMSFDEFLLQWPCQIELPSELDDAALVDEAYRAILLRAPDADETAQYLRLLEDGVVPKTWVIEDLLASEELRSLERRLRVIWGGQVITEPGSSGEETNMPAVIWPSRSEP